MFASKPYVQSCQGESPRCLGRPGEVRPGGCLDKCQGDQVQSGDHLDSPCRLFRLIERRFFSKHFLFLIRYFTFPLLFSSILVNLFLFSSSPLLFVFLFVLFLSSFVLIFSSLLFSSLHTQTNSCFLIHAYTNRFSFF